MKRAIIVGVGTISGVSAILALNPTGQATSGATSATSLKTSVTPNATATPKATATATAPATTSGSSSGSSAQPSATPSATPSASASESASSAEKTVKGAAVESGYGPVQVQVTGTATSVTAVTVIQAPQNDRHSLQISQFAVPELESQALAAQSASIDGVSGATYTTMAFEQSLASALQKLQG